MTFKIEIFDGVKNNMTFDKKVTFYNEKSGRIEAKYYYNGSCVNWLLSWGFTKGSLGEFRKSKALKTKKPYFSLQRGWFDNV